MNDDVTVVEDFTLSDDGPRLVADTGWAKVMAYTFT